MIVKRVACAKSCICVNYCEYHICVLIYVLGCAMYEMQYEQTLLHELFLIIIDVHMLTFGISVMNCECCCCCMP